MAHIISGAAGSGKTTALYSLLKTDKGNKILLVPDQFVFESERRVADELGEKTSDITVTGFMSLSEQILKKYCPRKTYADNTAKLAIMSRAIKSLSQSFSFYGSAARKPGFVSVCLSGVDTLKNAGISPQRMYDLTSADGTASSAPAHFTDKMHDIALFYSLYDKMLTELYDDRQDNLLLAARAIEENDCFPENTRVYIDGFDSFSGAQKEFLRAMADKGVDFTVAVCTDDSGAEIFSECDKTKALFENKYAMDCGKPQKTEYTKLGNSAVRYKNDTLRVLRDFLQGEKAEKPADSHGITLAYSHNMSGEADFVCANIRKLVRCEGYRYSDIAVICAAPAKYRDAVRSAALRYEVPLFVDLPEPVSEKPLLRYLDCLLCAAEDPRGINIIRYIRSGFARIPSDKKEGKTVPLTLRDQHITEEYANRWDLKNRRWDRPFPHITDDTERTVENIRDKTVTPLIQFEKSVRNAGGKELVKRFTEFLFDKADISAAIQGKCQDNSTRQLRYVKELTEEYNNLWRSVSDMLTSLYETLDDTPMTIGELAALIRTCSAQINLSRPPKVLDSVLFGDPARTRSRDVRAVFVMGAADSAFPEISDDEKGIFTAGDSELLAQSGLDINEDEEAKYSLAVLDCYKALTLAGEKLFVTFAGEPENASEYVGEIAKLIRTGIVSIDNLPPLYLMESAKSADRQYVLNGTALTAPQKRATAEALSECGRENTAISKINAAAKRMSDGADVHRIGQTAKLVFPSTALSPTAIEKLNGCKFSYFLQYGMELRSPSDITMSAVNYGSIMHYIMKYSFERLYADAKDRGNPHADDSSITQLIAEAMAEYREKYLLGESEMSAKFNTLYRALSTAAFYLLKYMTAELENSRFVPTYFELTLSKASSENNFDVSPYSFDITLDDGSTQTVTIGGTVDRVDMAYCDDGSRQIRVIDYKTGKKEASLSRIYYGLDLQLLLYLLTLSDNNKDNGCQPSAAVYYPAGTTPLKDIKDPSEELKRGMWLDSHRETGFAVEGTQQELERDNYNGKYIDKSGKQKYDCLYSATTIEKAKLANLESRIAKVIKENAGKVKSGCVDAKPLWEKGKLISCKYCEYNDICGAGISSATDVDSDEAAAFSEDIVLSKESK